MRSGWRIQRRTVNLPLHTSVPDCEDDAAPMPNVAFRGSPVTSCLEKLRRRIYVFRDRGAWRIALQRQTKAASLQYRRLKPDKPIRWNSTYKMFNSALALAL